MERVQGMGMVVVVDKVGVGRMVVGIECVRVEDRAGAVVEGRVEVVVEGRVGVEVVGKEHILVEDSVEGESTGRRLVVETVVAGGRVEQIVEGVVEMVEDMGEMPQCLGQH